MLELRRSTSIMEYDLSMVLSYICRANHVSSLLLALILSHILYSCIIVCAFRAHSFYPLTTTVLDSTNGLHQILSTLQEILPKRITLPESILLKRITLLEMPPLRQ